MMRPEPNGRPFDPAAAREYIDKLESEKARLEQENSRQKKSLRARFRAVVLAVVGAAGVATGAYIKAQGDVEVARQAAQAQVLILKEQHQQDLARLEAAKRKQRDVAAAERATVMGFLDTYTKHLQSVRNALDAYEKTPNDQLRAVAQREIGVFVEYVKALRRVNKAMEPLLNGNVSRLEGSLQVWLPQNAFAAQEMLERMLPDKRQQIDAALKQLAPTGSSDRPAT